MKTTKKAYVAPVVDVVTMVPEQMMVVSGGDPNQMSIKGDGGISGIENFDPQSNKNVWEDLW